jgi:hypothetical protein
VEAIVQALGLHALCVMRKWMMAGWLASMTLAAVGVRADPEEPKPTSPFDAVQQIVGCTGELKGDQLVIEAPRNDLTVDVEGQKISPALAPYFEIAFKKDAVSAELVVRGTEVQGVLEALRAQKLSVSAVHNHLLNDQPQIYFVHAEGSGDIVALAKGVRAAIDVTHAVIGSPDPKTTAAFPEAQVAKILDAEPRKIQDVVVFDFAGVEVNKFHMPQSLRFEPLTPGLALLAGRLVMKADAAPEVLRRLRKSSFAVTSVHDRHQAIEVHFMMMGDPVMLAYAAHEAAMAAQL